MGGPPGLYYKTNERPQLLLRPFALCEDLWKRVALAGLQLTNLGRRIL